MIRPKYESKQCKYDEEHPFICVVIILCNREEKKRENGKSYGKYPFGTTGKRHIVFHVMTIIVEVLPVVKG